MTNTDYDIHSGEVLNLSNSRHLKAYVEYVLHSPEVRLGHYEEVTVTPISGSTFKVIVTFEVDYKMQALETMANFYKKIPYIMPPFVEVEALVQLG